MAVDQKTNEALDLKTLKLPPFPPVSKIEWEEYEDWTGEPSLRLLVIFAENTDVDKITGEQVGDIKRAIRDSLMAHGISKFPYSKPSMPEVASTNTYEADDDSFTTISLTSQGQLLNLIRRDLDRRTCVGPFQRHTMQFFIT